MTAIEIATGIIDKLQEENRVCLETLHQAQDTIKNSERQLAEKDRLIKVLEERIRTGTDGILEMTNRQKELTIKHLELQIQKLLKENEEMEFKLDTIKSEICAKCETKLLLRENSENKSISKSYKPPPGKTTSTLFEKKTSQTLCPNRIKSLERIIDHKDKRITHLSKEVHRLTKTEKELTQKIYRLTKLLPMSRLPSETLTDCLLKEIQSLESQTQGHEKLQLHDDLYKLKKDKPPPNRFMPISKSSTLIEKLKKTSASGVKRAAISLPEFEKTDVSTATKAENEIMFKKLQKLCNDVNELKRLFTFESEKLSHGLNSTANEYKQFKMHIEDIISNLNDVIQSILSNNYFNLQESVSGNLSPDSDDKYVISCLQERLKESLGIITEYENENKVLNENLNRLKKQLADQASTKPLDDKLLKSPVSSSQVQNINDVKKLKDIIKIKETQLEAAESHINTCQKFIEELQKTFKHSTFDNTKMQFSGTVNSEKSSSSCELQNKALQTKLDVAEKNIKTCENVMEQLQNSIRRLEEENVRIESELHVVKSQKMSEAHDQQSKALHTKFASLDTQTFHTLKKLNQELQDKVSTLEEINFKLEKDVKVYESKISTVEATEQENTLLKAKLETSEKHICSLEKSVETLQKKLKVVEDDKSKIEAEFKEVAAKSSIAETYADDVMSLKNKLILKEEENRELKESLHTLENKALEMNYYRKSLHEEIENLCKALMEKEDSDDSSRRKEIYKAAVLRSAQALLRLDDNYNLKPDDSDRNSALEEMKHQIQVYLTEVARIHELVTIKEQERYELLKEYLDLNDDAFLRFSSPRHYESPIQSRPDDQDLHPSQTVQPFNALESEQPVSSERVKSTKISIGRFETVEALADLKILQDELAATKSVTTYLLSSCTRLEDMVAKERTERAKCERELEVHQEIIKDLKSQLSIKNNIAKRLNYLIDMMRSKECNDDITLQQLSTEMKWLLDENQKIFERITVTQSELCKCKEENSRIQNELDSLKRQLMNEKYENAKVNNELRHLRLQISNSQLTLNDT